MKHLSKNQLFKIQKKLETIERNIYNREFVRSWFYLLKFEAAGLGGKIFCHKKPLKKSRLLHLGCGPVYLDNFVNADYYFLRWVPFLKQVSKYDWLLDFRDKFKCEDNYWEGVFSEHTVEHLHYSDCLNMFKELYRTMKPGAWIRICVPGLEENLALYDSSMSKAEVIYNLTQNFGHVSVWDAQLMTEVLRDSEFTTIRQVSYLKGSDNRLLCDSMERARGSLYVEAQK